MPPLSVATFHTISEPFTPVGNVNSLVANASILLMEPLTSVLLILIDLK